MSKKFKAKNMQKLDNPMRRKLLPPDEIINMLNIATNSIVADVGCGIGYFSIPFGKRVSEGLVYAIDINEEMLRETERRVEESNLNNIEIVNSLENNMIIKNESVEMVFTSTVYHEVDDQEQFINECGRILKSSGRLIILDWNKVEEEIGPPMNHRIDSVEVIKTVEKLGYILIRQHIVNSFYMLEFKKSYCIN